MTNKGIIQIHGKDYMTVARRVELAHEDGLEEIITEILCQSTLDTLLFASILKLLTYAYHHS